MKLVEVVTIFALVAGPISSVVIAQIMQKRSSLQNQRMSLFMSLLATRTDRMGAEHLRSLALIDVTFNGYPRIRQKWGAYYDALCNPGMNDANGALGRLMKFNDMLAQMARDMGYGGIGFEEIQRIYAPQGLADAATMRSTTEREWLRLLQGSENLGTPRRTTDVARIQAPGGQ